jgi:hypothetical protein
MGLITALFGLFMHQAYLKVPDGYTIEYDRDPPRFAVPADRSNVVQLNVPTAHVLGDTKLQLRYDTESRGDIQPGTEMIRFRVLWEFD